MVIWPSYGKPPFWIGKLNTTKLLNHQRISVLISSPKGSKSFQHHSITIFPVGASSIFHLFLLLLGLFWWMNPTSSCRWANPPHPDTPADLRCCSFDLGAGRRAAEQTCRSETMDGWRCGLYECGLYMGYLGDISLIIYMVWYNNYII